MQTIITLGSVVGACSAIILACAKVYSFFRKKEKRDETNERHILENYLDIKRLVITSPYMPLRERIKAGDEYIKRGGNGEVKLLYNAILEQLDEKENEL